LFYQTIIREGIELLRSGSRSEMAELGRVLDMINPE
jgi:hypothetical protein